MSTAENRAIGRRFFEEQDRLKGPLDPEIVASNYRASIAGFPIMDAEGHGQFGTAFYSAFPDMRHFFDDIVPGDDRVVVRFTLRGTHTGSFFGIPATGKPIQVSAIAVLRVLDGQVVELNAVFDRMGLMEQLGAIPKQEEERAA